MSEPFKMVSEDELREEAQEDADLLLHLIHRLCNEKMLSTVPNRAFPIDVLQWDLDERGNLMPWLTMKMESGVKLAVLVAPIYPT